MLTDRWPHTYRFSAVYSADVIDSHRAARDGQASTTPQNNQTVPSPTRAVIILVPVRLGGEKTNPDYFNFTKVRGRLFCALFNALYAWNWIIFVCYQSIDARSKVKVFPFYFFRAYWVWSTASASSEGSPNRPATLWDFKVSVSLMQNRERLTERGWCD